MVVVSLFQARQKCSDDVFVAVEHSMAEVAFAYIEPNSLDWVGFGAVGRQQHQGRVTQQVQVVGDVPPGLVHHHNGVLAWRADDGELVKDQPHHGGVQLRQHQGEHGAGLWLHGGKQVCPGVALVA